MGRGKGWGGEKFLFLTSPLLLFFFSVALIFKGPKKCFESGEKATEMLVTQATRFLVYEQILFSLAISICFQSGDD